MDECVKGKHLLSARDNALDATKGIVVGKILGHPETPEDRARNVQYAEAVMQVHQPAYEYNQHVASCKQCQSNPPVGPYSKAS
jgi:hypothetical protein